MRVKLKEGIFDIIFGLTYKAGVSYVATKRLIYGKEGVEVFYPGSPGGGIIVSPDMVEEVVRR